MTARLRVLRCGRSRQPSPFSPRATTVGAPTPEHSSGCTHPHLRRRVQHARPVQRTLEARDLLGAQRQHRPHAVVVVHEPRTLNGLAALPERFPAAWVWLTAGGPGSQGAPRQPRPRPNRTTTACRTGASSSAPSKRSCARSIRQSARSRANRRCPADISPAQPGTALAAPPRTLSMPARPQRPILARRPPGAGCCGSGVAWGGDDGACGHQSPRLRQAGRRWPLQSRNVP